ncbi:hypothetical protein M569_07473 [Genlisea aurea]|uniref:Uncharacterized protein n=1 Tax=Genlisea aurea TaxID=192259 RepID=S8E4P6_9LAMI|nr:hypothetical protein M569_07473 [Genlisea aurea]
MRRLPQPAVCTRNEADGESEQPREKCLEFVRASKRSSVKFEGRTLAMEKLRVGFLFF